MQPLTLEETALKEEMKSKCLSKGNYIDKNAKAKFEMLCHLEDFEVQYWELKKQVKKQKEVIDKLEILIENLKLGVALNQEQEDLLDEILFRGSKIY